MLTFKDYLSESSLSRLYKHNIEHDCGAMTAWRRGADCNKGAHYSKDDNRKRNRSLLAKLHTLSYEVTAIKGRYPEGGVVTTEESFFIVDAHNRGTLEHDLRKLGEEFEQDSVLFIPKGAIVNKSDEKARLIGTNHCPGNWIKYGQSEPFNVGKVGHESPIYTSYVNGRPFIFEEVGDEYLRPGTGFGWWGLNIMAKKHWTELD